MAVNKDDASARGDIVWFGPFRLIASERLLTRGDATVLMGGRALDILIVLVQRAAAVVSKRTLIDLVWPDVTVGEASLRVHLASLRRIIGDGQNGARYIVNVPGRGYSFVAPVRYVAAEISERREIAVARSAPSTLPPEPYFMKGRISSVAAIAHLLIAKRFVTVTGSGGIGKTTVATAVALAPPKRSQRRRPRPDSPAA